MRARCSLWDDAAQPATRRESGLWEGNVVNIEIPPTERFGVTQRRCASLVGVTLAQTHTMGGVAARIVSVDGKLKLREKR